VALFRHRTGCGEYLDSHEVQRVRQLENRYDERWRVELARSRKRKYGAPVPAEQKHDVQWRQVFLGGRLFSTRVVPLSEGSADAAWNTTRQLCRGSPPSEEQWHEQQENRWDGRVSPEGEFQS